MKKRVLTLGSPTYTLKCKKYHYLLTVNISHMVSIYNYTIITFEIKKNIYKKKNLPKVKINVLATKNTTTYNEYKPTTVLQSHTMLNYYAPASIKPCVVYSMRLELI